MICPFRQTQDAVRHRIDGLEIATQPCLAILSVRHRIDGLETLG